MATAEELPSLSILTLPPCLLKVSQGFFTPLSDILLHPIPPFHWRSSSNIPSLFLTHKHPPGHFPLFPSLHGAKPLQSLSFHFFNHSTLLPYTHMTSQNAHTHSHCSLHPLYSQRMHYSSNSFSLSALYTSDFHSRPMFCSHM